MNRLKNIPGFKPSDPRIALGNRIFGAHRSSKARGTGRLLVDTLPAIGGRSLAAPFPAISDPNFRVLPKEPSDQTEPRKLKGGSLADYVSRPINEGDTLLGKRYLCRGGGMFVVAPSGLGKSSFAVQAAILWGIGEPALGIKPARPLRTLFLQAEDDEGDIIEMSQVSRHLGITGERFKLFHRNVWMEPINDLTGERFVQAVDQFLDQWSADLVIINPYTSFLGADIKDDRSNNAFLRSGLNPVLAKHKCGVIIIHHTPKTNFRNTDEFKPTDWMYSGAGAACLTNWARAYLVIDPTDLQGTYRFIAAKRGKRIGWGEVRPVYEKHFSHCDEQDEDGNDKILWVDSTPEQIKAAAVKKQKRAITTDDLLPFISLTDFQPIETIISAAKGVIGMDKVRALLKVLVVEEKVEQKSFPRPKAKPEVKYRRNE